VYSPPILQNKDLINSYSIEAMGEQTLEEEKKEVIIKAKENKSPITRNNTKFRLLVAKTNS